MGHKLKFCHIPSKAFCRVTTTLIQTNTNRITFFPGMVLNAEGDKLYITTENGLVRLTDFTGNADLPSKYTYKTGAAVMSMLDLALLHDDKYAVVTDFVGKKNI